MNNHYELVKVIGLAIPSENLYLFAVSLSLSVAPWACIPTLIADWWSMIRYYGSLLYWGALRGIR